MKYQSQLLISIVLLAPLFLLITGCDEQKDQKMQDKNIEAIESVLQKSLTGPDNELKKNFSSEEFTESINKYNEDHFSDFFTDQTSYIDFVNNYGAVLMTMPIRNEYTLKVKDIEYEKVNSDETIYNFSVDLEYQKEGNQESKTEIVSGQASLNDKHKIKNMIIRLDELWSSFE